MLGLGLGLGAVALLAWVMGEEEGARRAPSVAPPDQSGPAAGGSVAADGRPDAAPAGTVDPVDATGPTATRPLRGEPRAYSAPAQDDLRPLYDDPVALHRAVDPARWEDLAAALAARGEDSLAARALTLASRVAAADGSPNEEPLSTLLTDQSLLLSQVSQQDGAAAMRDLIDPLLMAVHALQQGGDHPAQVDPKSGRPR